MDSAAEVLCQGLDRSGNFEFGHGAGGGRSSGYLAAAQPTALRIGVLKIRNGQPPSQPFQRAVIESLQPQARARATCPPRSDPG